MPALLLNAFSVSPTNPGLPSTTPRRASSRHRCRAEASSSSGSGNGYRAGGVRGSWASDYDLYELLGVERSSPQSEIKAAYRSRGATRTWPASRRAMTWPSCSTRSTRCSPTLQRASPTTRSRRAGPSSPGTRAGRSTRRGWAPRPSSGRCSWTRCAAWAASSARSTPAGPSPSSPSTAAPASWRSGRTPRTGSSTPSRHAPSTASRWLRGRTWQLSEFLMSKQPRGRVRVSEGNTVGARAPNIFAEVDKFQKICDERISGNVTESI